MAKHFKQTIDVKATPQKLLDTLIDKDFQVAREKAQGSLGVKVKDISRTDDKYVYEVQSTEYAKGITGIDKSKTELVRTTYTWDLKKKSCTWTYHSEHGDRIKVYGALAVLEAGENSKLLDELTVEVKIPLVGKKIETKIAEGIEAGFPKYEKVVKEFAES